MAKAAKKANRVEKKAAKKPAPRKPLAKKANVSKKSSKAKTPTARAKPSGKGKKAAKKPAARKAKAAPKKKAVAKTTQPKKAVAKTARRNKAAAKKAATKKVATTNRPKATAKKAAKRPVRIGPRPPKPSPPTAEEKERLKAAQALRESEGRQTQLYGKAVKLFNSKKYSQALKRFEGVAEGPHPSLRHRAGVYVEICRQRLRPSKVRLKTADEHYNYGIQLVNERRLDEAESQFRHALKMQPKAAHVHLASAVLGALSGDIQKTYRSLKKAIDLDPRSRVLALNDADLSPVLNEPSIAALLHGNGASGKST